MAARHYTPQYKRLQAHVREACRLTGAKFSIAEKPASYHKDTPRMVYCISGRWDYIDHQLTPWMPAGKLAVYIEQRLAEYQQRQ